MAKNWTAKEAARVVYNGTDKEALQDIGRRFPLFTVNAARGTEGLLNIIEALNERISVRTIESVLKEDVVATEATEEVEAEVEEKPKKTKATKKKAAKDEEEEKPAKSKRGPKKKTKPEPEPEEDDFEDEEDEDESEDGYDEMNLVQLKKEAKKQKVNIKGLKTSEEIIAALRGEDLEEEDDEDEDDDWDL